MCSYDNYFFLTLDTSSSKNVCRTVKQVLRSHYAKLMESTETCLSKVASELYSKNLINKEVRHSPNFEKIEIDFSAMVSLYKGDAKKMMEVCSLFIECVSTAGGPAQEEAIALARDWENEVFKDHQVSFSLTKAVMDYRPKEVKLGFNDRLAIELRTMHKKYAKLITDITTYYASSGKHYPIVIARWVQNTFDETGLAQDDVTVDKIFERMKPHHSFIDINAINDLIEAYPIDDSTLEARIGEYADSIDKFIDSAELNYIISTIEAAIGESTKVDPKIILKLSGRWNEQTVGHVRKLLKYLFDEEAKYVTIKKFLRGSICIQFLVFSNRSVKPLIVKSETKIPFMRLLGIFQLIIDDRTVIYREEDMSFTFEESLLQSIASIKTNLEYHRLSLFLTELKIKLNYQNTNGKTPLMLASVGGHIEIFNSLLQNGADPVVKLPANKGYIGLNYLACTALFQHIYKSIGGERIIPRDDTSVEDMLEMAVKERGVSSHFYEPFMHVIKNNLKEKFQWLRDCFHALNSNFLKAVTNILTSKALVTETKQKFQSYIKEDVNCESSHQLVQLLQPHYSCLNVDLLSIPCTITEPIKEQVEDYNTNLKMFKDTTSLLELAMMTKGMQYPDGVSCSKLILRLNKSWCSRTITELNKMENFYLLPTLSSLNLIETHYDASSCTCTYFLPQLSQTESLMEAVFEQRVSLYKIGVFEVMIDDIPIMMEDEDKSFTFEAALQEAHRTNNENVLFFLLELNITLPIENDITALMIASERGDFLTVHFLLSKDPDINIQNNDGVTALIAASHYGHHQVVELLLSKVPDINIQNNNGWTALMYASRYGHHQVVELLLSKDPDINIQNNNGWTTLMYASRYGHHQVVELLLSKDPDINIQNNNGATALMDASRYGHQQVVELLLSKDPGINIQDNNGATALMDASRYGHQQVVELLLSKDPDINIQNNNGATALMDASRYGHHQVVELLLSKDPDINIQNNDRWTALIAASHYGHHQVVELLLNKDPDINIQNNNEWTALMSASANGHHQVVELLLSKDPDINILNNDGWTALMFASVNGHHQVVELLLSKNPDINIQDNNGLTALMAASRYGHYQVVELLLSKDPDINIQNNDGVTALMFASATGHYQVVELLLSKDPNINIQNNNGATALMDASRYGHHQVVELLLSKDPDINILNNDGWTALMFASVNGHHQVVELLLSKNPHIKIQNNDGWTALMSASANGHHQVVELLLNKDPDINIQNNNGWTSLMSASANGHHQVVELLLSKDPDINILNNDGWTALMFASVNGHHQVVELLLSKNPDINIQNNDGWTALMAASRYGHQQVVELLLSKDPDINIQNNDGVTALMFASATGHYQVVELLLSKDPNINILNNDGWTALMFASVNGHHQVVELLLSKNPDINIQNNDGWTALMAASRYGHQQVVELLLSKDPDINIQNNDGVTALMFASATGHYQVVELLLSKDPNINILDNDGWTALMFASVNGHHQVVELLLSKDPNINIQNNNGATALMFASSNGHHQVVELLLSKDQDINIQDNNGWTALMCGCFHGHHQVVELLLSKNPDINIQDNNGLTALMIASANGHHQVVELLLSKDPDINIQNNDGWTALIAASCYGHHQVVELLLNKDSDINIQNNDGWTALTYSCFLGHHQVVEPLLSKNPDINIQVKDFNAFTLTLFCSNFTMDVPMDDGTSFEETEVGTQMLSNMRSGNFVKILKLLLNSHPNHILTFGDKKLHSLSLAALFNNFDAVEILIRKCDITPEHIISAFTVACYEGHSSMIIHLSEKTTTLSTNERKLLVAAAEGDLGTLISMIYEVGMSPDTPLVAGITPLMIAATSGHIELVDTLIQAGTDVNKRNDEGKNALDIVSDIEFNFYDRSDIKELLITNTPAVEPDPVSNNDETTNSTDPVSNNDETTYKKPSTVSAIKSILGTFNTFMKKAYNPYYSKQKELKIPHGVTDTSTPHSAMTSNMSQFVS